MSRCTLVWILAAGCGRIGFDGPEALTIGASPNEVRDTKIWSAYPDQAFAVGDHVSVDTDEVSLIWFDLAAVAPASTVVRATLTLTTYDSAAPDGGTVLIYRMRAEWVEGDIYAMPGAPSWLERMPSVAWPSPGAGPPARDPSPLVELRPLALETAYPLALPMTLVQTWLDDPATNFGIGVYQGTATGHVHIRSKESGARWATLELALQ